MAIDPSISLQVRPPVIPVPQIQTPLEQFARVLSLHNLMTQGQSGELGLKIQQLQYEQAQREEQERKDYANDLRQRLNPAPATPAAATPGAPLGQLMAPQPQTAVQPPTPLMPGLFTGAPGAPLGSLVAPQPPPVATPSPSGPATPPQAGTLPGGLTPSQLLAKFPIFGPARLKALFEMQKEQADVEIKQHEKNAKIAARLGSLGISVRDAKDPAAQFAPALRQAVSEELIKKDVAEQMIADGYDKHANDVQAFIDQAQNVKDYSETKKNDLAAQGEELKNATAKLEYMGQKAQLLTDKAQIPAFIAEAPPELRPYLTQLSSLPLDAFKQFAAPVQQQKVEQAGAIGLAAKKAELGFLNTQNEALVNAVIADKTGVVYANLPPERQKEIAPVLAQRGWTQFAAMQDQKIAEAVRKEKAKAALAPGVFSGIIDPVARTQAMAENNKNTASYIKSVKDADQLLNTIDAAQKGNQTASAVIPIETIRAMVNRVTNQELKSVGGGTSIWRKATNWVTGATSGTWSAEQLKDFRQLAELQRQAARQAYDAGRQGIEKTYNVSPPDIGDIPRTASPAGGAAPTQTKGKPLIKTKADYDALPHGTVYMESDGNTYRKP